LGIRSSVGSDNVLIGPFIYNDDEDIRIFLNVTRDHNDPHACTAQILVQDATDDAFLNSTAIGLHPKLTQHMGRAIWYNGLG
jgi:hypothetical protein